MLDSDQVLLRLQLLVPLLLVAAVDWLHLAVAAAAFDSPLDCETVVAFAERPFGVVAGS